VTYDGVKVFSATRAEMRETLGEKVTEWSTAHPELEVVDVQVCQSSDRAYHCLSIAVFYSEATPS